MAKKKLDTKRVVTELTEGSVFFREAYKKQAVQGKAVQSPIATEVRKKKPKKKDRHASMPAVQQAGLPAIQQYSMPASWQSYIRSLLSMKGTKKATYRLPPSLEELLEDTIFALRRRMQPRPTKRDAVLIALARLLWDHHKRGTESLLSKALRMKAEDS
jgi:hypothetical protein